MADPVVSITSGVPTSGTGTITTLGQVVAPQGASTSTGESGTSGPVRGPLVQGATLTSAPTYTTGTVNPLTTTLAGALRVDGSAVTQPVSGTVTANPSSSFGSAFPATGTAVGVMNSAGTAMTNLSVDGGGNLHVVLSSPAWQQTGAAWTSSTGLNTTLSLVNAGGAIENYLIGTITQTTTITGGAITFEETWDQGTSWKTVPASRLSDPSTGSLLANPYTLVANAVQAFQIVLSGADQVRARLSTVIAGTGSATIKYSQGQQSGTANVNIANPSVSVAQATAANLNAQVAGDTAAAATDAGNPVKTGGRANVGATYPTAVTNGQRVNAMYDKTGKQIATGALREMKGKQYTTITTNTSTTVVTAGGAGTFNDVYAIVVTNTSATATSITFNDGAANQLTLACPAGDTRGFTVPVDSAIPQTNAAGAWTATAATAVTSLLVTMLYVVNT